MKIEGDLALDSYESTLVLQKRSFCSKLWYFFKLTMFGAVLSIVLTLMLVFLTSNGTNCLPRFSLIVQRKYVDGCLNDGLYGSERACNEYYKCENGIPIPNTCEYGQEWSSLNNTCVPRKESDCSKMFFCPKTFGKFRNELHCDTFYSCFFNQAYLIYCPPPLLFSSKTNDCEWPEDSDCPPPKPTTTTTTTSTTTTTTTTTTEKIVTFNCPRPEGFFADPEDCTAYYQCDANVGTKYYCGAGRAYDSKHFSCNSLENSDCAHQKK